MQPYCAPLSALERIGKQLHHDHIAKGKMKSGEEAFG